MRLVVEHEEAVGAHGGMMSASESPPYPEAKPVKD
jgi:hypothetical protein